MVTRAEAGAATWETVVAVPLLKEMIEIDRVVVGGQTDGSD